MSINNTNGNLHLLNVKNLNDAAHAMGYQIGTYASFPTQLGTIAAPTVALNQGGYYPMQDSNTGSIFVQKLSNGAETTGSYFDQISNTTFSFNPYTTKGVDKSQLSSNMTAQQIQNLFN